MKKKSSLGVLIMIICCASLSHSAADQLDDPEPDWELSLSSDLLDNLFHEIFVDQLTSEIHSTRAVLQTEKFSDSIDMPCTESSRNHKRSVEESSPRYIPSLKKIILKDFPKNPIQEPQSPLNPCFASIGETDIWNIINDLPGGKDLQTTNLDAAQNLYENTASQAALDTYLQLRANNKDLSPQNAFNRLSPFLKVHFKGVSIQNLVDNNLLPLTKECCITRQAYLDLSNQFINGLTGTKSLPKGLSALYLNENKIITIPPDAFTHFSNLRSLELSDNKIIVISSKTFKSLTHLRSLSLNNNKIADLNPEAFANLVNLRHLSLNNNKITSFALGLFTPLERLESLNLSHNLINSIPLSAFAHLTKLKSLDLSNNLINSITPGAFIHLAKLQSLYLTKNKIPHIALDTFMGATGLQELFLNNNPIISIAPGMVTILPKLQILSLVNTHIEELEKLRIIKEMQSIHAIPTFGEIPW